jgi:hypothetical protein
MRSKMRVVLMIAGVLAIAACSGGAGGNAITGTTPPDTTKKTPPPPASTLDSVRRGVYDNNNVLHLYPDTLQIQMPVRGAVFSVAMANAIAFTSNGVVTDAASMQGMYGAFVLSSDTPSVVTPGGSCGGGGWACMMVQGTPGTSHVTLTLGTKSVTVVVLVQ